jgi:hypothetical protein
MSILFGYDYFDTTAEDLNTLKQKLTTVEKAQQGNTAEIVKHTNDIVRLNSLGKNSVQYDFSQIPGYPPGFLQTSTITDTDKKNAKFMVFKVGGFEINFSTPSSPYGFYEGSIGTVVMFTVSQRSAIIRTSFSFMVQRGRISLNGLEFKNIDPAGNATARNEATTINCSLLTT